MQKSVKFDLDQTVVQLGLEEKTPFIEPEQHATMQQLLMSRYGIYIGNGNGEQDKLSPKRGSSYPGVRWFYNNWDFDAAGLVFEKIAHKDIFDALRDDLAIPLRFQDFDRARQKKNYVENSTHFEYATYLSARDMARLGLLAISHGCGGRLYGLILDSSTTACIRVRTLLDGTSSRRKAGPGAGATECSGGRGKCQCIRETPGLGRIRERSWRWPQADSTSRRFLLMTGGRA